MQPNHQLHDAIACLRAGHTVAIPTETVYGLAANALDAVAVAEIFRIKNRPAFDPLIVHVASLDAALPYVKALPELVKRIYAALGPGPVTYILPKNECIPDLVTAGHPTVGVRIPDHPLTIALLNQIDFPLAAPSANPFGFTSPTTAAHVQQQLGESVCCILDGGPCRVGLESTILDFSGEQLRVLRLGGLSLEALEAAAGRKIDQIQTSSSNPQAPGMLIKHYNPGKPLRILTEGEALPTIDSSRTGLLRWQTAAEGIPMHQQRILAADGKTETAAARLFAALRELGELDIDLILAEEAPQHGLGLAINDRLRRAAASSER